MESINLYWQAWLAYCCLAVVGLWCWDKLFFWLAKGSDMRRLMLVLGAVLLLTPASINSSEALFAPAIFVLMLDVLGGMNPLASPALIALLAVSCIAVVALAIGQVATKKKKTSQS